MGGVADFGALAGVTNFGKMLVRKGCAHATALECEALLDASSLGETSDELRKSMCNFMQSFWTLFGRASAKHMAEELRAKVSPLTMFHVFLRCYFRIIDIMVLLVGSVEEGCQGGFCFISSTADSVYAKEASEGKDDASKKSVKNGGESSAAPEVAAAATEVSKERSAGTSETPPATDPFLGQDGAAANVGSTFAAAPEDKV
jgi:hypothetical protein